MIGAGNETGDRIEVRGFELLVRCGVLPEETERAQPFQVDIDIYLDLAPSGVSDDLGLTVNYGEVIDRIVAQIQPKRFSLLEKLAQAIADLVLSYPTVDAVTIRVAKLRPPVAAHVATTGVSIHRRQAGR